MNANGGAHRSILPSVTIKTLHIPAGGENSGVSMGFSEVPNVDSRKTKYGSGLSRFIV